MEALFNLRPAKDDDMIFENRLVENRVYFEKSLTTGMLCGPYQVFFPDTFIREMLCKISLKLIYLPSSKPVQDGLSVTLAFRNAVPEDLRTGKFLNYNFIFFLFLNNQLNGPYVLNENTNLKDIAVYLNNKKIFVLAHRNCQQFPEINLIAKAV